MCPTNDSPGISKGLLLQSNEKKMGTHNKERVEKNTLVSEQSTNAVLVPNYLLIALSKSHKYLQYFLGGVGMTSIIG